LKEKRCDARMFLTDGWSGGTECCAEECQDQSKSDCDDGAHELNHSFSADLIDHQTFGIVGEGEFNFDFETRYNASISCANSTDFHPLYVLGCAFEV